MLLRPRTASSLASTQPLASTGDPYVAKTFTWDSVIALANGAKGEDAFGDRADCTQLARAAKSAASQETLRPADGVPGP